MDSLRFSDFETGVQIGVGTVGTIYQVTQISTGKKYALKLLAAGVSADALVALRFEREMTILQKLRHPNIVGYLGGGQHGPQLFYVMELVTGGTLKDLLRDGPPLGWREAAECARQLAAALQHAHNHGIIHRDLKPGNVFFTPDGTVKLGDFGIARDMREKDLTDVGLTVGTYAYMAPELIRGQRAISGQVDLYGLGCLLFEMLTSHPPYVGDNFAQIFEQHLHAEPPRLADAGVAAPPAMQRLINHLLAKSPEDRPFNARAVQGYLGEMLDRTKHPRQDQVPQPPPSETALGDRSSRRLDKAAIDVTLARELLAERIQGRSRSADATDLNDVSWGQLGWFVAGILAVVLAAVLLFK